MKISCAIADDLLPLYVDESCSEDSKAALEEHMKSCPACLERCNRMNDPSICPAELAGSDTKTAGMVLYAKKIRRRRTVFACILSISTILFSLVFIVMYQAFAIMERPDVSVVSDAEKGVFNLTSGELVCSLEQIDRYLLYTNSGQIIVTIQAEHAFSENIMLWNADIEDGCIMISNMNEKKRVCIFTNLSSENYYVIRMEGTVDGTITVRDKVDFWSAVIMSWETLF